MRLGWVRCDVLPEPDHDEELALAHLRQAGIDVQLVAWDSPEQATEELDAYVLRATWNYYREPERFLAWVKAISAQRPLWNLSEIVQWNAHKSYLLDLDAKGIPIIPTALVARGENIRLADVARSAAWSDIVIKPAVSAGSFCTRRFDPDDPAAQGFLDQMLRGRDMLVQRYEPSVELGGELCLIYIDGQFTHAVTKRPRFSGDEESVTLALCVPDEAHAIAQATLGAARSPLLYARVDLIERLGGRFALSELELIEPSLFFFKYPRALDIFASALHRWMSAAAGRHD